LVLVTPARDLAPENENASENRRVLLVEEKGPLRDALVGALQAEGYDTRTATSVKETLHQLQSWYPELLLIDLLAHEGSGLDICRQVAGLLPAPIIVLAPVDATIQLLEALESGATDYATRPLDGRALMTRIHTTLARSLQIDMPTVDETVEVGPLIIEPSRRRVFVRGTEVHFAKMEYAVLLALALRPGEIRTNSELLDEIWAGRRFEDPRTLSTHIRRIRKKLESDPGHPQHLLTVRGVGFYFNADGQES
jgi:two-component system, OmpR family, response regulator RegX3